jgi:hypothetical protein
VDQEHEQQPDLDNREQRIPLQRVRVLVEDGRPEEDHQVAGDVNQEVKEKGDAGDADDDLRADR